MSERKQDKLYLIT